MKNAIEMAREGVRPIPLRLENVEEGLSVSQLGWDNPEYIYTDSTRRQNYWRLVPAWRRFRVDYVSTTHRYFFKSQYEYLASQVSKMVKHFIFTVIIKPMDHYPTNMQLLHDCACQDKNLQSVQQERVLGSSKTIRFLNFFFF